MWESYVLYISVTYVHKYVGKRRVPVITEDKKTPSELKMSLFFHRTILYPAMIT
jgi:hypothetical protein